MVKASQLREQCSLSLRVYVDETSGEAFVCGGYNFFYSWIWCNIYIFDLNIRTQRTKNQQQQPRAWMNAQKCSGKKLEQNLKLRFFNENEHLVWVEWKRERKKRWNEKIKGMLIKIKLNWKWIRRNWPCEPSASVHRLQYCCTWLKKLERTIMRHQSKACHHKYSVFVVTAVIVVGVFFRPKKMLHQS